MERPLQAQIYESIYGQLYEYCLVFGRPFEYPFFQNFCLHWKKGVGSLVVGSWTRRFLLAGLVVCLVGGGAFFAATALHMSIPSPFTSAVGPHGLSPTTPGITPPGVYVTTRTIWSSEHPGPTYATVFSLTPDTGAIRWQHREEWFTYHSGPGDPVVVDGLVYMVADTNTTSTDPAHPLSGMLLALRASDGHQVWRTEIGTLASTPLVAGPTIYVSAEHLVGSSGFLKEVYALNRSDGSVRWKTEIPNTRTITDALTLSQGHLVLSSSQLCFDACSAAYLMALDAQSGHLAWQLSFSGNVTIQPPVVDGDIVYVHIPGYDPGFYAFRVTDGRQLWQGKVGSYIVSGGIVYTDKVLTAPNPSRSDLWHYAVAALDGQTGAERWETPTDIYPGVLAIAGEQVIVKSEIPNPEASQTTSPYRDVITALRVRDGKPLWNAQQDAYFTGITVASDTVFLTLPSTRYGEQAYVAALHLSDGHVLWQQRLGPAHPPDGSSLVGVGFVDPSGKLLCSVSAGVLYGVRTSDGQTLWNAADLTASGQLAGTTVVM